ncbi:MAG: SNF2-related protein, partial [Gemmatimonadaceae bacterium]
MKHKRTDAHVAIDRPISTRWTSAPAAEVCAYIATAALSRDAADLSPDANSTGHGELGTITLRPHQRDAIARVQRSLNRRGGALLADAVGLGKTYVALALARDYDHAHIIAPATLLPMWRQSIAAAALTNVSLHSLQTLSRRPLAVGTAKGRTLTIVDEAHHLRTRNTVRYRHAQQFVAAHDVLLLSATPVHNRARELRNLLLLFLGNRADLLDRETLAECVIRRTAADEHAHLVPTIQEHAPHAIPDNREVLECILQLAPPLPVNEGAAASALVRLGLLRAWCSSDAALTDRIRRRQLRGESLLHSLAHGRYPTQRELESWIVGNDAVQLGFP